MANAVRPVRGAIPIAALLVWGCTGTIAHRGSDPPPADGDDGHAAPEGQGGARQPGPGAGGTLPDQGPATCESSSQPRGRIRALRLRWPEYQAVVARVLQVPSYQVSTSVPQDPVVDAYPNDGMSLRVPTYAAARVYLDEADAVLAQVAWPQVLATHGGCNTVDDPCVNRALPSLAAALFRRPLDANEAAELTQRYAAMRQKAAVAPALTFMGRFLLNHPSFLYRFEGVETPVAGSEVGLGPFETASALAFTLTGGPPDATLVASARSGALSRTDEVRAQVRRLLDDHGPLARVPAMLGEFANSWLVTDPVTEKSLGIDRKLVEPMQLGALLQDDLGRTFTHLVRETHASFADLATSSTAVSTGALARAYGYPTTGDGWSTFDGTAAHRMGLFSSPAFLAARGATNFGRIIYRGVFTLRRLLCFDPGDPVGIDVDQALLDAKLPESLPDRKKLETVTGPQPCQVCHGIINPVGLAMDAYDAAGRHASVAGQALPDTRVTFPTNVLGGGTADGFEDLARTLAGLDRAGTCFTRHLGRYLAQSELSEAERCQLQAAFAGRSLGQVPVRELIETTLVALVTARRR